MHTLAAIGLGIIIGWVIAIGIGVYLMRSDRVRTWIPK